MAGINCMVADAQTKKWAQQYNLPEKIIQTIQQTALSESRPIGLTTEEFIEQRIQEYISRQSNSTAETSKISESPTTKRAMTKKQKFYKLLDPTVREFRYKRIAADFDYLLNKNIDNYIIGLKNSLSNAATAEQEHTILSLLGQLQGPERVSTFLKTTSISEIFEAIRSDYTFYTLTESEGGLDDDTLLSIYPSTKGAQYVREQMKLLVDNFDALVEDSLGYIEELTGIQITLNEQITRDGDIALETSVVKDENEENENTNINEDVHVDIGGGTSFKVRMKDNFKTLTPKIYKVLGSTVQVDVTGEPLLDDLGTPQYLSPRNVHGILGDELSSMISSEDFVIKEDNNGDITYTFPALSKIAKKYAWANQIIDTLNQNPHLIGAFYGAFRKDFIKRFIYKKGKGILPANETSIFGSAWKELNERLNNGVPIAKHTIYDASGIYLDRIESKKEVFEDLKIRLPEVEEHNKKELIKFTNELVEAFASIGVKVTPATLKDAILDVDFRKNVREALYTGHKILTVIASTKEASTMMTKGTRELYISLLQNLNIANENHAEQTYRQGGKSYPSYTVPGYIETLFKKLSSYKGSQLTDFLESEFKNVTGPFYMQGDHGRWLNSILRDLANTKTRTLTQNNLVTCELSHIDGVEYSEWQPKHITKGFVGMFFEGDYEDSHNTTAADYAYYNVPIFSDSPVVKFVKLKRYKSTIDKSLTQVMMPLFVDVVKTELMRMSHIEARKQAIKEGKTHDIANYDTKGTKFQYFTELNKDPERLQQMKDLLAKGRISELESVISEAVLPLLEAEFESWLTVSGAATNQDLIRDLRDKGYNVSTEDKVKEVLWDYYLNQSYATSQIIQLLVTDPAYYKNSVDFQKRFKEVYAAGIKLNTQTRWGKPTQKAVILKDRVGVSRRLSTIKQVLDRGVSDGHILNMDRDNVLHKLKNYTSTDGQALRTLPSLKGIYDMMGVLNEVEESLDRIASGRWDMHDFYAIFQTLKPFVYTSIKEKDGLGGQMRIGQQHKDSEFPLLLYQTIALALDSKSEMKAIQDFLVDNKFDVAVFESGVKTGAAGVIDIYNTKAVQGVINSKKLTINDKTYTFPESIKDIDSIYSTIHDWLVQDEITQEELNAIIDTLAPTYEEAKGILENAIYTTDPNTGESVIDTNVVHELPYEDYCITMSTTSDHLTDSETVYGTQFNSLIVADLDDDFTTVIAGKTYNNKQIKSLYQDLKIENLLEDYERVKKYFQSPEILVKEIIKRVDGNAKYNRAIKDAVKLVNKKDPNTGNIITTFAIPTNNPTMTDQIQEIVLSIFKNNITKQKIKGGTAFLVSDIGYTKELQIEYEKDEKGNNISIKYIPCYLPCTCKEMFKDLLVEKVTDKGVTYYELDIDAKNENGDYVIDRNLLNLIGYRIPTEHKYSMAPLRIKGFLPKQNGSSVMLPSEAVVVFSGADYDIDKLFLMMYEYHKIEYNKPKAQKHYNSIKNPEVSFDAWWKTHKGSYRLETPVYRKTKYNWENSPEDNTRAQRNNALIDISWSVLTNPKTTEQILKPQGFDSFIRGSILTQIGEDSHIADAIMRDNNITDYKQLASHLLNSSNEALEKYIKDYKIEVPLLSPRNFLYYHQQNMAGGNSLGAYANNTTRQTKYQDTGLASKIAFNFNGRTVSELGGKYTIKKDPKTGETVRVLITQNCCEGVGASADNAKQPTISTMRQRGGLISLSAYLLSAGLSMDDVALFFAHPIIAHYIDEYGILNDLESGMGSEYEDYVKNLDLSSHDFTSQELMELILVGNNAKDLTKQQYKEWERKSYPVIRLVSELWRAATALGRITKVSRADSTNGAIGHNFGLASTQLYQVDEIQAHSLKKGYPLTGLEGVPMNIGFDFLKATPSQLRARFKESKNPLLQAFHSLGIEMPQYLLRTFFTELSEPIQTALASVHADAPSGVLSDNLANSFLKHYTIYRLGNYHLFRTKGDFMTTRRYYLNRFPYEFKKILKNNPNDLGKNEILNRIQAIQRGKKVQLQITDSNLITETEAIRLRSSLDELLYMDNPAAQELAMHLFAYSYFSHSLAFLPHSWSRFYSPEFMAAMPGFIEKLEDIQNEMRNGVAINEYKEYWYNNTTKDKALRSYVYGQDVLDYDTFEEKLFISKKTKNISGDWRKLIKLKIVSPMGTQWKLLEFVGTKGEFAALYREIPHQSSMSIYNPDMSVFDTIKVLKQQQELDKAELEKEDEVTAWKAGVWDSLEADLQLDEFPEELWSKAQEQVIEEDSTIYDVLADMDNQYVVDEREIAAVSKFEQLMPDSIEDENLCPPVNK